MVTTPHPFPFEVFGYAPLNPSHVGVRIRLGQPTAVSHDAAVQAVNYISAGPLPNPTMARVNLFGNDIVLALRLILGEVDDLPTEEVLRAVLPQAFDVLTEDIDTLKRVLSRVANGLPPQQFL